MTDEQIINKELWDRARWRGVAYGRIARLPPFIALVFEDREPAGEIFANWRERVGPIDHAELIRIAIIEGDIPGQDAGYTVHVGPNTDRLVEWARQKDDNPDVLLSVTRLLRMTTPSTHLEMFKGMYGETGRYLLVAGALTDKASGKFDVNPGLTIEKKAVVFRQANDVSAVNDFDSIVLARPDGARAQWN
jgi:hypothetical protein